MTPMQTMPRSDADEGVVFPLVADSRSTSATGREIVADAVRAVAPALADDVLARDDWRAGYLKPFREMTRLALVEPAAAATIATAGLAAVHARFRFRRDGEDRPLDRALVPDAAAPLVTVTVPGRQRGGPDVLSVPYRGG